MYMQVYLSYPRCEECHTKVLVGKEVMPESLSSHYENP